MGVTVGKSLSEGWAVFAFLKNPRCFLQHNTYHFQLHDEVKFISITSFFGNLCYYLRHVLRTCWQAHYRPAKRARLAINAS